MRGVLRQLREVVVATLFSAMTRLLSATVKEIVESRCARVRRHCGVAPKAVAGMEVEEEVMTRASPSNRLVRWMLSVAQSSTRLTTTSCILCMPSVSRGRVAAMSMD